RRTESPGAFGSSAIRADSGATTTRSAPGAGFTIAVAWTTPRILPTVASSVFTDTTGSLSTSSTGSLVQPPHSRRTAQSAVSTTREWSVLAGLTGSISFKRSTPSHGRALAPRQPARPRNGPEDAVARAAV